MPKTFVLRTHALLSSRRSTLNFGNDNEIVIPMTIIDEIRDMKKESFEKRRIARELLEYLNSFDMKELTSEQGVKQKNGSYLRIVKNYTDINVEMEGLNSSAKRTLQVCLGLMEAGKNVILVSNNLALQIKAKILGIKAESFKDEIFPSLNDQYAGRAVVHVRDDILNDFFRNGNCDVEEIFEKDMKVYENQFFIILSPDETRSALGQLKGKKICKLKYLEECPYGVKPKNVGQKFMIEALLNDECPLVIIKGSAGTGKTFITLACGLSETTDNKKYERILVTRSVSATEQYGYLPGDIEEKLSPYLAGIKDNLSILINGNKNSKNKEDGSYFFEKNTIQIQAIGFLRGRSIVNTYFIIDETQNIEPDILKSIVTRAGEGSKFIFLGDPTQIDNPDLNERYNGLVYLSEKMKGKSVQVSLLEEEYVRSKLAKEAAKIL